MDRTAALDRRVLLNLADVSAPKLLVNEHAPRVMSYETMIALKCRQAEWLQAMTMGMFRVHTDIALGDRPISR